MLCFTGKSFGSPLGRGQAAAGKRVPSRMCSLQMASIDQLIRHKKCPRENKKHNHVVLRARSRESSGKGSWSERERTAESVPLFPLPFTRITQSGSPQLPERRQMGTFTNSPPPLLPFQPTQGPWECRGSGERDRGWRGSPQMDRSAQQWLDLQQKEISGKKSPGLPECFFE